MICKLKIKYYVFAIVFLGAFLQGHSGLGQQTQSTINYDKGIALAHQLAIEGKYEVARLLCHRILQDVPEYFDAYFIIGNTYAWDKQFEKARFFYYKVFEYNNGDINTFNQLITMELWEGNPGGAINLVVTALEFEPNNSEILFKKARAHIMLGEFLEAKKALFLILSREPANSDALQLYSKLINGVSQDIIVNDQGVINVEFVDSLFLRARDYAYTENFPKAFELIDLIIESQPSYLPAYVLKAQTHAWVNEYDIAREIVRNLNIREPKLRPAVLTAIDIELWSENYSKAILLCDSLGLKHYPGDYDILFRKAQAHKNLHEYYFAKRIVFDMMENDPDNVRALQYYNELIDSEERYQRDYLGQIRSDRIERGFEKDSLLATAREFAFDEKFAEAQAICFNILSLYPDDYDAKYLLGLSFAWMGDYDEARKLFNSLIQTTFDSSELLSSMIDLEIWDQQYDEALSLAEYGLRLYPKEKDLLLRKASIYQSTNEPDLASEIFRNLLILYPEDIDLRKSYIAVKGLVQLNAVGAAYTFNSYSVPVKRSWHMLSSSYYHANDIGTIIAKVNTGYAADDTTQFMEGGGIQFEIDAYPVFHDKKRYFYLNYGFSPSNVFARHRFGANVYQDISKGWELSAGLNYSFYKNTIDTTHVVILRAGINKYWDYFMVGLGATFAPSFGKLSQGYTATARKYLRRPDNWIQIAIGAGIYPENPFFYLSDPMGRTAGLLQAYSVNSSFRYLFGNRWIGQLSFGYQRQEYLANFMRNSWSFNLAVIYLLEETF